MGAVKIRKLHPENWQSLKADLRMTAHGTLVLWAWLTLMSLVWTGFASAFVDGWEILWTLLPFVASASAGVGLAIACAFVVWAYWDDRNRIESLDSAPVVRSSDVDRVPFLMSECACPPDWRCERHGECRGCCCACDTYEPDDSDQLEAWNDDEH